MTQGGRKLVALDNTSWSARASARRNSHCALLHGRAPRAGVQGSLVQDCEVCCNPWLLRIEGEDDERTVTVTRADGSE
jgi:hypothetical protein